MPTGCPVEWRPSEGRLTLEEGEEISLGLHRDETFSAIARRLERSVSTVSREVGANGGRTTTAPGGRIAAPESAPIGRSRPSWPAVGHRLAAQVEEWLAQWWSPEAISRRLRMGLPELTSHRVV